MEQLPAPLKNMEYVCRDVHPVTYKLLSLIEGMEGHDINNPKDRSLYFEGVGFETQVDPYSQIGCFNLAQDVMDNNWDKQSEIFCNGFMGAIAVLAQARIKMGYAHMPCNIGIEAVSINGNVTSLVYIYGVNASLFIDMEDGHIRTQTGEDYIYNYQNAEYIRSNTLTPMQ